MAACALGLLRGILSPARGFGFQHHALLTQVAEHLDVLLLHVVNNGITLGR